jgi:uncharacterized protein (DUF2147 family)
VTVSGPLNINLENSLSSSLIAASSRSKSHDLRVRVCEGPIGSGKDPDGVGAGLSGAAAKVYDWDLLMGAAMTRAIFMLAVGLLGSAAPATTPAIEGMWLTDDHAAIVAIRSCGRAVCGYVDQVLDKDPSVPKTDVENADPALRSRPILGLPILTGFIPEGAVWTGGRAYDPKTGRSYRSTLALNEDGSLKVTGCLLFICESRRWTRVQ